MQKATVAELVDLQGKRDERQIPLERVGVSHIRCPIVVLDRSNRQQNVTATVSISVNLPHHFKGTHMSRFIETLNEHRGEITLRTLPVILRDLKHRLDADSSHMEATFAYFLEIEAPVSKMRGLTGYRGHPAPAHQSRPGHRLPEATI